MLLQRTTSEFDLFFCTYIEPSTTFCHCDGVQRTPVPALATSFTLSIPEPQRTWTLYMPLTRHIMTKRQLDDAVKVVLQYSKQTKTLLESFQAVPPSRNCTLEGAKGSYA